tara:strand:+ start:32 stop:643 length:612 start_codon:yes stop_codon:yes gene_type:complete
MAAIAVAGVGLMVVCSSSLAAAMMMGGEEETPATTAGPAAGPSAVVEKYRYVKIMRDKAEMGAAGVPWLGNHHLNLMEAKVMSGGENIAFQKNTTSSSTHAGLSGGRLVDGDMTTMAHTDTADVEWFLIDLGAEYEIDQVEIYNRTDPGGSFARTRGVQIKISKNADMSDSVDSGIIQVSQVAIDKPKLTWVPKDGPGFIASA